TRSKRDWSSDVCSSDLKYTDSKKNNEKFGAKGITFFDVGTSGGVSGARNGACMMIGGDRAIFRTIEPIFASLCVENGYLFCGEEIGRASCREMVWGRGG